MPMMSRDLRFSANALDVIGDPFPEMDILPAKPDMHALYTEKFLKWATNLADSKSGLELSIGRADQSRSACRS